ncbi:BnaC04g42780D [Brassica napus]|uniref:BnaC04g42780D protein n=1 Tax=Brassica napus TaxID=3708 RepID=A0A078FLN6_BRANA|nr:BnaC04g42780D [Brassica napus]
MMKNVKLLLFFISISLLLIAVAEAQDGHEGHSHSRNPKCECSHDHDQENKAGAQKYKIAAVPSVLIAGVIGVLFPLLGKVFPSLRPETPFFFVTKAFAAGVILSTGFMHVLPEAYEMLNSPCLTSEAWDFPFTGFIAMVAAILTLSVDTFATSSFNKSHCNASKTIPDGESGELVVDSAKVQMLRTRVIAQVCCLHTKMNVHFHFNLMDALLLLRSEIFMHGIHMHSRSKVTKIALNVLSKVLELGIIVHSVVIGISLGASQSPEAAKALFIALMFHQCFEGLGLGGCIAQGKFKCLSVTIMSTFFAITTPLGIVVGMEIANTYDESSPTALIVQGVLNAASAGILIYMSLVDLLAADFMHPKMQSNTGLQIMAHIALLLGAGLMSILAKWA